MNVSILDSKAEAIRREFARRGVPISQWARAHGYSTQLVYQVLAGRKRCIRGQSHQIAVHLGLKDGILGTVADIDALATGANQQSSAADKGEEAP